MQDYLPALLTNLLYFDLSVLGPVSPNELGVVLPHEHILVDFSKGLVPHPMAEIQHTSPLPWGTWDS